MKYNLNRYVRNFNKKITFNNLSPYKKILVPIRSDSFNILPGIGDSQ